MAVVRPAVALEGKLDRCVRTSTGHAVARHPRRFGRGRIRRGPVLFAQAKPLRSLSPPSAPANDLRLFAVTFAAGFLFVSILIG